MANANSAENFELDLKKFVERAGNNAHAAVRAIVLELGTRIVNRSPVGKKEMWAENIDRASRGLPAVPKNYVGGRFRANWQYGNTQTRWAGFGTINDVDPTGSRTIRQIANEIPQRAAGMVHVLANNLPYAQRLEDGWSKQAPQGMVLLTVIEFQDIVRKAVEGVKK